jgi:hypothetical protein
LDLRWHTGGCNAQGQVVDPVTEAPAAVRRLQKPDSLCVMFFGGPADKVAAAFPRPASVHPAELMSVLLRVMLAVALEEEEGTSTWFCWGYWLASPASEPCAEGIAYTLVVVLVARPRSTSRSHDSASEPGEQRRTPPT